jgi:hypothetical protein
MLLRMLPALGIHRMRLRFHLGLLIVATLLPTLAFSAWLIAQHQHQIDHAVEEELIETARALRVGVDRKVGTSIAVLEALAASEHLRAGRLRLFDRFARSVLATQPVWETIALYDTSGQQLMNLRLHSGQRCRGLAIRTLCKTWCAREHLRYRISRWGASVSGLSSACTFRCA